VTSITPTKSSAFFSFLLSFKVMGRVPLYMGSSAVPRTMFSGAPSPHLGDAALVFLLMASRRCGVGHKARHYASPVMCMTKRFVASSVMALRPSINHFRLFNKSLGSDEPNESRQSYLRIELTTSKARRSNECRCAIE
jgi:hypothetical protein